MQPVTEKNIFPSLDVALNDQVALVPVHVPPPMGQWAQWELHLPTASCPDMAV